MNFQKLLNDLLTIKSHAESLGMKSDDIAGLEIVESEPMFGRLKKPTLEFELAEDKNGKKCLLFKNLKAR